MAAGSLEDGGHVAGHTGVMHGNDRPRTSGDGFLDPPLVKVERIGADVDENRPRSTEDERIRGRDERERRHDHLITLADVAEQRRHLQRRGAGMGEEHFVSAAMFFEPLLTTAREDSIAREVSAAHRFDDVFELTPDHRRQVERDVIGPQHPRLSVVAQPNPVAP